MATGGRSVEESWGDDFRHTCTLCMERYRGRHPKLLPCFHTFCLPCLTTLAATAAVRQPESTTPSTDDDTGQTEDKKGKDLQTDQTETASATENEEEKGDAVDKAATKEVSVSGGPGGVETSTVVFLCPTCRAPVTVPEGGVENLQNNFYLDTEDLNTAAPSGPVPCDMCEEGEKQDATHYCTKCRQNMCRACRRLHDKLMDTNIHRAQPVKATIEQPLTKKTPTPCPIHPDHSLCLHCVKCDVNICMLCKLTSHEGHATEDMAAANLRANDELKGLIVKASEQVQVVEAQLCRLDRNERELLRQKQEVTRELHTRFEKAVATVARARDDVMDELVRREQTASSKIRAERLSARNTLETLSNLLTRARHEADIVSLNNEVQAALLTDDAVDSCRTANASVHEIFFVYQADIADLEKDMVHAYMGKLQDPMFMATSDTAEVVSLRELVTTVSNLTAKSVELQTKLAKVEDDVQTKLTEVKHDTQTSIKAVENGTQTKLTKVEDAMQTKLNKLKNEMTSIKTETLTKIKKVETASLGNKTGLEKLTTMVSTEVSNLTSMIQKSSQRVTFCATLCAKQWKSSDGPKIIFDRVRDNEGSCYNKTTGIFTCPCDGTYVFHTTIRSGDDTGKKAEVKLSINGKWDAYASGTKTCYGSTSAASSLNANDKVWVEPYGDGVFGKWDTAFSGALIQAKVDDDDDDDDDDDVP